MPFPLISQPIQASVVDFDVASILTLEVILGIPKVLADPLVPVLLQLYMFIAADKQGSLVAHHLAVIGLGNACPELGMEVIAPGSAPGEFPVSVFNTHPQRVSAPMAKGHPCKGRWLLTRIGDELFEVASSLGGAGLHSRRAAPFLTWAARTLAPFSLAARTLLIAPSLANLGRFFRSRILSRSRGWMSLIIPGNRLIREMGRALRWGAGTPRALEMIRTGDSWHALQSRVPLTEEFAGVSPREGAITQKMPKPSFGIENG